MEYGNGLDIDHFNELHSKVSNPHIWSSVIPIIIYDLPHD